MASESLKKQRALLMILLATCERALEAFHAADNVVDEDLVADLERVVARTTREIEALNERLAADVA